MGDVTFMNKNAEGDNNLEIFVMMSPSGHRRILARVPRQ